MSYTRIALKRLFIFLQPVRGLQFGLHRPATCARPLPRRRAIGQHRFDGFRIKRPGEEIALAHIIAPTEDETHRHFLNPELTLGPANEWFTTERVDRQLTGDERDGLAPLLSSAPTCMARYNPIAGYIAHVAAVHRLRLYRSMDYRRMEILAAAPNEDVAKTIYDTPQSAAVRANHQWFLEELTLMRQSSARRKSRGCWRAGRPASSIMTRNWSCGSSVSPSHPSVGRVA